jgi:hypothetical protein
MHVGMLAHVRFSSELQTSEGVSALVEAGERLTVVAPPYMEPAAVRVVFSINGSPQHTTFTYVYQTRAVFTALKPSAGSAGLSTMVSLIGANFFGLASSTEYPMIISLGGHRAVNAALKQDVPATLVSSTLVTVLMPPRGEGLVSLDISNNGGFDFTPGGFARFVYLPQLAVTRLTPSRAPLMPSGTPTTVTVHCCYMGVLSTNVRAALAALAVAPLWPCTQLGTQVHPMV